MASKGKKRTLADKINSLVTTKPTNFDSDDEDDNTKAKIVDHYEETDSSESNFQASKIRRRNVDPLDQLDKRYIGKKISRKDVYNTTSRSTLESEEESNDDTNNDGNSDSVDSDGIEGKDDEISNEGSSGEDDGNEEDSSNEELSGEDDDDEEGDSNDELSGEDEVDIENKSYSNESSDAEQKSDFQTMSHTNVKADIDKGNCVRSQLNLWENLLEIRIKLQKCLFTSNQMPQFDDCKNFKENSEYATKTDESTSKLKLLLNNMLQLQHSLLKQYPETKNLSVRSKKRKAEESIDKEMINTDEETDEEIPSDTEDENEKEDASISSKDTGDTIKGVFSKKLKLDDYEKLLSEHHKSYVEYRNSIIQKWNEKTRIASGKLNKGMDQTTLKQVEFALNDKEKLRKRTQLKRSEYIIIGKVEPTEDNNEGRRVQEYDSEIYDDDDFYHQLLRDLIEYKSADITDPIQLSKQWIQLQNMRRKMKRKIDTRATKGRRIRYNVHNKLVNFMAPITINDVWSNQAKDELYNSLFGKIK
ncbi:apoptosis antagonizing transcription factor [Andrena cerasifolii]|uniref:apoptosis antagonizing transcription factor n=1 Tax=Andrena cerasifolii TaxID=2819439 RepID=UPI0040377C40